MKTVVKERFLSYFCVQTKSQLLSVQFVAASLHILEVVEPSVHLLIVPLDVGELVEAVDGGQRIDDVRAQEGVDVVRGELASIAPVLGPVCHVTDQFTGRH